MMNPVYAISATVVTAILASLLVAFFIRRWITGSISTDHRLPELEAELLTLREAKIAAERLLAVEQEKSSRIPILEHALSEKESQLDALSEKKAAAEAQLATATEGLARVEAAVLDLTARLSATEQSRDEIRAQLAGVRDEKGHLEETLAAKSEAISHMETASEGLRMRLEAAELMHTNLNVRFEVLGREKADLESTVAEKSAFLAEKIEASTKLVEQFDQTRAALASAQRDVGDLRSQLAALQESLDQERRQGGEKLALLTEAKERMTQEFKLLANGVMQLHGENFSKQNKEQIDAILTPLREKLGEFQLGIQTAQTESTKERATLAEQIRHLSESSAKMTTETSNLARALRGEAQTQGAWGEMILASILEKSGLREGEEYVVQQSLAGDEGQKIRPDVMVNLPGGQRIVVDSKLSLVAFDKYVNAEDDAERAGALQRHLTSMRTHIKALSGKEYHAAVGSSIDYVIMFVPIEGALAAALHADANLTSYAVENGVAIATPTTLMIALRTVNNVWQVERRNRNAEAIAERAGRLYDKFVGFLDDMRLVGGRLEQAKASYSGAMGKLSSGSGNILRQVEQLKELGAKTGKSLPPNLLDGAEVASLPAVEVADTEAVS